MTALLDRSVRTTSSRQLALMRADLALHLSDRAASASVALRLPGYQDVPVLAPAPDRLVESLHQTGSAAVHKDRYGAAVRHVWNVGTGGADVTFLAEQVHAAARRPGSPAADALAAELGAVGRSLAAYARRALTGAA